MFDKLKALFAKKAAPPPLTFEEVFEEELRVLSGRSARAQGKRTQEEIIAEIVAKTEERAKEKEQNKKPNPFLSPALPKDVLIPESPFRKPKR